MDYDAYSYSNNVFNYNGVSSDITLKYSEKTILTTSTEGKHFKEADYVSKIKNVEFVDYIDERGVSNALKSYELSKFIKLEKCNKK